MINLQDYIIEKLKINNNIDSNISKYEQIFKVHPGDKILVICKQNYRNRRGDIFVTLHTAVIDKIVDDKVFIKDIWSKSMKYMEDLEYTFEDPEKTTTSVPETFALYRPTEGRWVALMKKDKAIIKMHNSLKYGKSTFGSYKLLDGVDSKRLFKELEEDLNK